METKAPGRGMLKVTGIVYIILGVLATLCGLLLLAGGGMMMQTGESTAMGLGAVAGILSVLILVSGVFYLIVGILGVKNCNKPEKCGVNFVLGIILMVLVVFNLVTSAIANGPLSTGTDLIALVLAILYLIGARQNKNAAAGKL